LLGIKVSMGQALIVTLFSMSIVFLVLLAISFIMDGFKAIFYKKKSESSKSTEPERMEVNKPVEESNDNKEIIAVIATTIAAYLSSSVDDIYIKKIQRVPQNTSIWGIVGRQE
jgi:glutaconyl-CoA/methylmalonyl-CoA decarboxylase subunit delta